MSSKPPLMMLAQRLPFPPDKGEKIRSYHLLRHLVRSYDVHLATCVDDPADEAHLATVRSMVASLHVSRFSRRAGLLRAATHWPLGEALSFGYFRDAAMDAWVDATLERTRPDIAIGYSSNIIDPLLRARFRPRRIIADFVDVDSQKWRDYAKGCTVPKCWLFESEARRTHKAEQRIGAQVDALLFVSSEEAALFRQLHPSLGARTDYYANGVDLDAFRPDAALPRPQGMGDCAIVFTGRMDYWPNVDAVRWFAQEVLPGVRADIPEAQFYIVGSAPNADVQALAAIDGIIVTGRVARVQDWVQHAAVAIAPMRIGRGIQNKVLEAMAMAKPVVVSREGLTGINAQSDVIVPQDARGWRESVVALLKDAAARHHYGQQARAFVEASFSWEAQLQRLDRLIA